MQQNEQKASKWTLLLAEIQETWSRRGVNVLNASDSVDLGKIFQHAGLSEERSNREVIEALRNFDEKLRRAA
jgi:uracil DNA glycosylase